MRNRPPTANRTADQIHAFNHCDECDVQLVPDRQCRGFTSLPAQFFQMGPYEFQLPHFGEDGISEHKILGRKLISPQHPVETDIPHNGQGVSEAAYRRSRQIAPLRQFSIVQRFFSRRQGFQDPDTTAQCRYELPILTSHSRPRHFRIAE